MTLTDEEKRIVRLFAEINPVFDELAKHTWPELFEPSKRAFSFEQQFGRIKRYPEYSIKVPTCEINKPSPFPIDYEDEYDV